MPTGARGYGKRSVARVLSQLHLSPHQLYEEVDDDSCTYIKLYNLQSKVMCNKAYGRLTKSLLPFLTSIHIAPRPIWLCRGGRPIGNAKEEDHNPSADCKVRAAFQCVDSGAVAQ